MEIKDANGNIILSEDKEQHPDKYFIVADSSYRFQEIMGDNNIVLNFSLSYYNDFPIGCKINFQSTEYTMMEQPHFTKVNERQYDYTLTFESPQKQLYKYKFRNHVDGRLNFTLTAQPFEFIDHIVRNLNMERRDSGWSVGECVVSAEKTASFSHNTLGDALGQIAQLFETEWEINGKTISLRKVEYNTNERKKNEIHYGKGGGFLSGVSCQKGGENAVDVLWVEGGDRNIDSQTYTYTKDGKTLHANKLRLPRKGTFYYLPPTTETDKGTVFSADEVVAMFPDEHQGEISEWIRDNNVQIFKTDADGFGIFRNTYINNGYEDSLDLSDIYPHKVLYVQKAVLQGFEENDMDTADKEKMKLRFWDIYAKTTDKSAIPNYNDCLIGGQDVTVVFNTGMLAGKEFNLGEQIVGGKKGCYDPGSKKFLIQPAAIDGITMPDLPITDKYDRPVTDGDTNGTGYVPRGEEKDVADEITYIGDEFAVFHCNMPQQYIEEAEMELLLEGCHYLWQHSEVEVEFSGTVDPIWSVNKWDTLSEFLVLGGYVNFSDDDFCNDGRMLRILSIKTYLNNPHAPELTLSNSSVAQSLSSEIRKIAQNQVYTDYRVDEAARLAQRRGFKDAEETQQALQQWAQQVNNYFSSGISPITIQTMQLLVGDKSLQYEFGKLVLPLGQDNAVEENGFLVATWTPNFDKDKELLVCPLNYDDGTQVIMRHRYYTSADGDGGTVRNYGDSDFPYWQFAANTQNEFSLDNADAPYYLYIVAPKTAATYNIGKVVDYATFEVVEITDNTVLPADTDTHYYFLCAIINSEQGGTRSLATVYGSVEITGSQIKLSNIVSNNRETYIDLTNNVIQGNIYIKDGQLTKELILGDDPFNNLGGMTGGDLYDGDATGTRFEGKKVRFWMGTKKNNTIKIVDKPNSVPLTGRYEGRVWVPARSRTGRWIYGASIVFYSDGSYRIGPLQYAPIVPDSDWNWLKDVLEVNCAGGTRFSSKMIVNNTITADEVFAVMRPRITTWTGGTLYGEVWCPVWIGTFYYDDSAARYRAITTRSISSDFYLTYFWGDGGFYGVVRIEFCKPFRNVDDYFVTGQGKANDELIGHGHPGFNPDQAYISIADKTEKGFRLYIGDDSTTNNNDFYIQIWARTS